MGRLKDFPQFFPAHLFEHSCCTGIAGIADHVIQIPLQLLVQLQPAFFDGNGRTTRAVSYLVFIARLGYEPGGTPTSVDMIAADKFPYYDALDSADAAWQRNQLDVSDMSNLVSKLLASQLLAIVKDAGG